MGLPSFWVSPRRLDGLVAVALLLPYLGGWVVYDGLVVELAELLPWPSCWVGLDGRWLLSWQACWPGFDARGAELAGWPSRAGRVAGHTPKLPDD